MNNELINSVDLSKSSVQAVADQLIELAEQGNPLEVKLKLKAMSEAIDEACKKVDKMARDEAEKHGAKTFDFMGCGLQLAEAGTKYNYKNCNDSEWNDLYSQFVELKAKLDVRQEFLQSLKKTLTIVNDETGEITEIHPPSKTSTSIVKITLK